MPSFCAVLDCADKYGHGNNISFHKFPFKNKELLAKWIAFTQRQLDWRPTQWNAICSRHFLPEDYKNFGKMRKILKKTSVPTIRNGNQQQVETELNVNKTLEADSRVPDGQHVGGKQRAGIRMMRGKRVYEESLRGDFDNQNQNSDEEDSSFESTSTVSNNLENASENIITSSNSKINTKSPLPQRLSPEASKFHCRLCGCFTTSVVTFSSNFEIYGMVQKCFPTLNIRSEDNLPKEICRVCLKRVKSFASFIDDVLETQSKLQKKLLVEKPSNKSNERQLKFKQEPTASVLVKTEINDKGYGDQEEDIEANAEETPVLESCNKFLNNSTQEQQQIDQKLQFYDFSTLNAQDIINNCDIMEIINLDDPFIDIPDDDGQNERLNENGNELQESLQDDQKLISHNHSFSNNLPHELLTTYMLIEEHSYASNDLKEESHQRQFYKTEKVEATEISDHQQEALSAIIRNIHKEYNQGDRGAYGKGDSIPDYIHEELVEATPSSTMPSHNEDVPEQRLDKPVVTSVDKIEDQSSNQHLLSSPHKSKSRIKPNIVVLNESIVKSSPAFQLQECPDCHLKFFSNETLSQHQAMMHSVMGTSFNGMVSVPSENLNCFSATGDTNFQTDSIAACKLQSNSQEPQAVKSLTNNGYTENNSYSPSTTYQTHTEDSILANKSIVHEKKVKSKNKVKILDMQQTFPVQYQGSLSAAHGFETQNGQHCCAETNQNSSVLPLQQVKAEHIINHNLPTTNLEDKTQANAIHTATSIHSFIGQVAQTPPIETTHYGEQMNHNNYLNMLPTSNPDYQNLYSNNSNPQEYSTMNFNTPPPAHGGSIEGQKLHTLNQNNSENLTSDFRSSCSSQLYDGFSRTQSHLTYGYCQMNGNVIANHSPIDTPQSQPQPPVMQSYLSLNNFTQQQQQQHQLQHQQQQQQQQQHQQQQHESQSSYNSMNFCNDSQGNDDCLKMHSMAFKKKRCRKRKALSTSPSNTMTPEYSNYFNPTPNLFKNTFYFEKMATDYLRLCRRYRALQMKCWHMESDFRKQRQMPCNGRRNKPKDSPHSCRCNVCHRTFETIFQLLKHKQNTERHFIKRPKSQFSHFYSTLCVGCQKYFCTKLALRNHSQYICQLLPLRYLKRIQIKSFKCRYCCQITFTHWRLYRRHEIKCSSSYLKRKRRKILDANSINASNGLESELEAIRSTPLLVSCLTDSSRIQVSSYKCDLCSKSFVQRKDLSAHKRGFHLQIKMYQCTECKQRYASKNDMLNCKHSLATLLNPTEVIL